MRNFITRAITGILFVCVFVVSILWNPLSFSILFTLITALVIHEFCVIVNKGVVGVRVNALVCAMAGSYLFLATMEYCTNGVGAQIFLPYIALVLYLIVSELYLKRENPIHNWAYSLMSQVYIAVPFVLLNILAFRKSGIQGNLQFNPFLPLAIFVFIWLNDTGAYCIGMLLGKHRLFPRISPKKSWEGSIGGACVAVAGAFLMGWLMPFLSTWQWVGMALTIVVFGTWGDLVESLLKRTVGIKDSGNVLPGHGGMLDRFDSALLAIPAALLFLYASTLIR